MGVTDTDQTTVSAPNPTIEPTTSSPVQGTVTPPIGQLPANGPAPASISVPPKPGQTFHNLSHSLMGAVLGAVAGSPPPASYSVDPTTGVQTPVAAPPDTSGSKLRRIAQAALIGLAAGSKIDPSDPAMKSGAGRALAGLGAGAEGERDYSQQQDLLKRKQAQDQFQLQQEAHKTKQQDLLDDANIAHLNIQRLGLAQQLGQANDEFIDKEVASGQEEVPLLNEAGIHPLNSETIPYSKLSEFMAQHGKGHSTLDYQAVGRQPALNPDGSPKMVEGQPLMEPVFNVYDVPGKTQLKLPAGALARWKGVDLPGADQLKPGQSIDYYNLRRMDTLAYQKMSADMKVPDNFVPKTDANGNLVAFNEKSGLVSTPTIDGKPIQGSLEGDDVQRTFQSGIRTGLWKNDTPGLLQAMSLASKAKAQGEAEGKPGTPVIMSLNGETYAYTAPKVSGQQPMITKVVIPTSDGSGADPFGVPVPPMKDADFNSRVKPFMSSVLAPAESTEKAYQMTQSAYNDYLNAKKQGKSLPTGAQAMVLLSNHLATTFGTVKGARVTGDMIEKHLGARSVSDDAEVAVNRLINGDPLSDNQWKAYTDLISQSRNITWQLAYDQAKALDLPRNFLPQGHGKAVDTPTMDLFLDLAGGDPTVAAKAMGQLGWKVGQ